MEYLARACSTLACARLAIASQLLAALTQAVPRAQKATVYLVGGVLVRTQPRLRSPAHASAR